MHLFRSESEDLLNHMPTASMKQSEKSHLEPSRDLYRLLLAGLVVMSIGRVHEYFGLSALRPGMILGILAVGYGLLKPGNLNTGDVFRYWPAKVVLALGVFACVAAPFGMSLGASATYILTTFSKALILAFLLIVGVRGARDLFLFNWGFVVASATLVFYSVFVFQLTTAGSESVARLNDLYTFDSNDLGCIFMVGLPLSILTYRHSRGVWKLLSALVVLGIGVAVARGGSRAAFLGLVVVGIALLIWIKDVSLVKRAGIVGVVAVGLFVSSPQGYWERIKTLTEPTQDYNWTQPYGRKALAERGLSLMIRNPVFGVGVNNFARADNTLTARARYFVGGTGKALKWRPPHNSYVQVGSELGVPGLLLWSSILLGGVAGMWRLRKKIPSTWHRGDPEQRYLYEATLYLPIAIMGFAITSAFVSFAYLDPIYYLAAFTAGVYISVDRKMRHRILTARGQSVSRAASSSFPSPGSVSYPRARRNRLRS